MTVTTDRVSQGIVGNGAQTVFNYTIPYQSATTLFVYKQTNSVETLLRQSVDYTIVATATPNIVVTLLIGGASVFALPPDGLTTIWVKRDTPITQSAYDLTATSPWVPVPTEAAFDALTLMVQELDDKVGKSIKVGDFDEPVDISLTPDPDKYLKWDETGTNIISGTISDQQITELDVRIDNLELEVATLGAELNNLEVTVTTSIGDLQSQISANDTDITALQTTVTDHGIRISVLETDMSTISDQAAAVAALDVRVDAIEAALPIMQDDIAELQVKVTNLEARMIEVEARNFTYRRTGRVNLYDHLYPVDTIIPGLVFDYDFTSSSILNLEIRRSYVGDERVELYTYSAVWINGAWNLVVVMSDIPTAPTGIEIVMVQDLADKAIQLYFNAPTPASGTYVPLDSWIVWTTEDMVKA